MNFSLVKIPLSCLAVRLIADVHALAGIHGDVRHGERQVLRNGDRADTVVVNGKPLYPNAIDLLRLMDLNALDKLIQHPGRQFPGPRIFSDRRNKHIRCHSLALGALDAFLQGFDFVPQLLLLVLVFGGHPGKTLVCQFTCYIVALTGKKCKLVKL